MTTPPTMTTHHLLAALHQQLHQYQPTYYAPDDEDGLLGNPTIIITHNQRTHYIDDFGQNTLYLTTASTPPLIPFKHKTIHKHDPQLLQKIQQWVETPK